MWRSVLAFSKAVETSRRQRFSPPALVSIPLLEPIREMLALLCFFWVLFGQAYQVSIRPVGEGALSVSWAHTASWKSTKKQEETGLLQHYQLGKPFINKSGDWLNYGAQPSVLRCFKRRVLRGERDPSPSAQPLLWNGVQLGQPACFAQLLRLPLSWLMESHGAVAS